MSPRKGNFTSQASLDEAQQLIDNLQEKVIPEKFSNSKIFKLSEFKFLRFFRKSNPLIKEIGVAIAKNSQSRW